MNMMKVDLHLHLDGSMTGDTIDYLHGEEGNTVDSSLYSVGPDCADLLQYLEKFDFTTELLQTKDELITAAFSAARDAHHQGVDYIEVRFAPALHTRKGLTLDEIVHSVISGLSAAHGVFRIGFGVIIICMRNHDLETNMKSIEIAKQYYKKGVVAVDLAGDEVNYDMASFAPLFDGTIPCTIHAGEAAGPENVRTAIEVLGASRIGHGVRSIQDPTVMELLRTRKIPVEFCPSSNIQTKAVPNWKEYPIKEFMDYGIIVTVNTDNPGVSDTTLDKEFELLRTEVGLTEDYIDRIKINNHSSIFPHGVV